MGTCRYAKHRDKRVRNDRIGSLFAGIHYLTNSGIRNRRPAKKPRMTGRLMASNEIWLTFEAWYVPSHHRLGTRCKCARSKDGVTAKDRPQPSNIVSKSDLKFSRKGMGHWYRGRYIASSPRKHGGEEYETQSLKSKRLLRLCAWSSTRCSPHLPRGKTMVGRY